MRWGRRRWWLILIIMSAAVLELDIATGPYLQFPILFVAPVGLGAWFLGRRAGIGFAVVLGVCRLLIAINLEAAALPMWSAVVNAGIRLIVLVALAILIDQVAWQRRTLAERVQLLEGILPICVFCKKIRRDDGSWERIETYVSQRSTAQFSHGYCNECARDHYPEFLSETEKR